MTARDRILAELDVGRNGDGGHEDDEHRPSTWAPVDLTAALEGEDVPAPSLFKRTDGVAVLYAGRTHWFQGESESCKTWAAGGATSEVLGTGGHVLWIDFEDDDRTVVARLRALGIAKHVIADQFVYVRPEEPLMDRQGRPTQGGIDLGGLLEARSFELVVVDGVTEAMVTEGLDLIDNADVASWMRRVPKRLAATGAAVLVLDHLTKSREAQGRYAIGGQHKLAGITGAAYRFEVTRPFSRAIGAEPSKGTVTVTVTKDRPGYVRAAAVEGRVGTLELTGWPDGGVSVALVPPGAEAAPDIGLCRRIAEYLMLYEGASKNVIEKDVPGKAELIRSALAWMAEPSRAWISIQKSGQAHRHYLTDQGQEVFS